MDLSFYNLDERDFSPVLELSDLVNGKGVIGISDLDYALRHGTSKGLRCSYVAYDGPRPNKRVVGFRLTYAAGLWQPTEYHSPEKWKVASDKVCRFNSVAVHPDYRRLGIGRQLMGRSIDTAKRLGAQAGVTHVWLESPNNSAYEYWTRLGGELVQIWPEKWHEEYQQKGATCAADGQDCRCTAAEMILYFGEKNE